MQRFIDMPVYVREKKGPKVSYKEKGKQTDFVISDNLSKYVCNVFLFNLIIMQLGLPKEYQKLNHYIGNANAGSGDSGGPIYQIKSM